MVVGARRCMASTFPETNEWERSPPATRLGGLFSRKTRYGRITTDDRRSKSVPGDRASDSDHGRDTAGTRTEVRWHLEDLPPRFAALDVDPRGGDELDGSADDERHEQSGHLRPAEADPQPGHDRSRSGGELVVERRWPEAEDRKSTRL